MFVLVIENFNMFWKGKRVTCDFRIILVFSSLYRTLENSKMTEKEIAE